MAAIGVVQQTQWPCEAGGIYDLFGNGHKTETDFQPALSVINKREKSEESSNCLQPIIH